MHKYLVIILFCLQHLSVAYAQSYTNWTEQAGTDKKYIALIIANDEYEHVGQLQESVIMASDLEEALALKGFDVLVGYNKDRSDMLSLVNSFADKYTRYKAAMIFYLGHGIQVEGENYLIPTDARLNSKDDVEVEAIHLDYLLKKINNANIPKAIVLDACRNNPFAENWVLDNRALVADGLTEVKTSSNVEVYLTTGKNKTVPDNNPYLTYFIEEFKKGGCLYSIVQSVTRRVIQYYNGGVIPDRFGVLLDDICFDKKNKGVSHTGAVQAVKMTQSAKTFDDGFDMVFIRGGAFEMGNKQGKEDEKPAHTVTLSDFYMGKYEVTQAQWTEIMGNNPSEFKGCDDCPVESVSWYEIQAFLKKLNKKTGKNYCLPTEAQWEFVAREGRESLASVNYDIGKVAWYEGNSGYSVHPVGEKESNGLGVYGMFGNVSEFCSDWYAVYSKEMQKDPAGFSSGTYRVFRGGSCFDSADKYGITTRGRSYPHGKGSNLGFRLCHK